MTTEAAPSLMSPAAASKPEQAAANDGRVDRAAQLFGQQRHLLR